MVYRRLGAVARLAIASLGLACAAGVVWSAQHGLWEVLLTSLVGLAMSLNALPSVVARESRRFRAEDPVDD